MPEQVKLYVYDLSNGLARQMSLPLTGRLIEAIYHTSVVFAGSEYYYGQGIFESKPGKTVHGTPMQIVDMGETSIPLDVFKEFLEGIAGEYTASKYHLLDHNCNNFSNECCMFLTGRSIPNHILSLPAEFLSTPFGQSILPMIENMYGRSNIRQNAANEHRLFASQESLAPATALAAPAAPPAAAAAAGQTMSLTKVPQEIFEGVKEIYSMQQLATIFQKHRAIVIDFTSPRCGPCVAIAPVYESIAEEYHDKGIRAFKVNTTSTYDVPTNFQIRATPTFIFLLDGKAINTVMGAQQAAIRAGFESLRLAAFPPHRHAGIDFKILPRQPFCLFTLGKPEMVIKKLQAFVAESGVVLPDYDSNIATLEKLFSSSDDFKTATSVAPGVGLFLESALKALPVEKRFPVLDLFRLLLLNANFNQQYTNGEKDQFLSDAIESHAIDTEKKFVPTAVCQMALRLACNLFASTAGSLKMLQPHLLHVATNGAVQSLLSTDSAVRQTGSSLTLNIAIQLRFRESDPQDGKPSYSRRHSNLPTEEATLQSAALEIFSAAAHAVTHETDEETLYRLLSTIGHLMFADDEIVELADALELRSSLKIISDRISNNSNNTKDGTAGKLGPSTVKLRDLTKEIELFF